MDNRVESNKALKAHPVESNTNGGLVVRNQSGFSTIYRLIDLSLVTILYYSAAAYYGTQIDTTSLILLFVNVICFQISGLMLTVGSRTHCGQLMQNLQNPPQQFSQTRDEEIEKCLDEG